MKKDAGIVAALMITVAVLFGGLPACAGEAGGDKNWEFNLAPFYLWAFTIDGDITTGTNTVPVNVPFSDITDSLEAAFIVHFEGIYKNNWGFLIDVDYLSVSNDVTLPGPFSAPATAEFDATIGELSGLYRIQIGDHSYDIIAGLRYTALDNKLTVTSGPTLVDADQSWLDPIAGLRWRWRLAEKWSLVARGDIGGLVSNLALQGLAVVDWQPFTYVSFLAGYRALYQDYEDGSGRDLFRYDATIHGPLLGINFRW